MFDREALEEKIGEIFPELKDGGGSILSRLGEAPQGSDKSYIQLLLDPATDQHQLLRTYLLTMSEEPIISTARFAEVTVEEQAFPGAGQQFESTPVYSTGRVGKTSEIT